MPVEAAEGDASNCFTACIAKYGWITTGPGGDLYHFYNCYTVWTIGYTRHFCQYKQIEGNQECTVCYA
jgi:hypothetical protein